MILNAEQHDSLIEVINIAFGRAAGSLSAITGQRVLLNVPSVEICPIDQLQAKLQTVIHGDVATVQQVFSGAVSGTALLMIDFDGALNLSGLLTDSRVPLQRLDASDREVLMEVGNILLNACLGTLGNVLKVHISFAVPRLHVESIGGLLGSLTIDKEELMVAMLVLTKFELRDTSIGGYMVVVLGVSSLDKLLEAIAELG
ncbi:MAG: CheC, inhibitor of MCP methylation [uncultured bacterium]|nr:MAG: CheC, inhibitor of MCP methylation [uncultured bacterium]